MLKSLQKTKNPIVRAITGATATFSLLTMIFALIIGISNLKENRVSHKIGVYGSLLGAIAGAIIGGTIGYKPSSKSTAKKKATDKETWQDWRNFVVERKVKESTEITSFYLKPQDGKKLPDFKPGQFLTIKLDIPEQPRPVIRTYSLSDYNKTDNYYRLSIKKEVAPSRFRCSSWCSF